MNTTGTKYNWIDWMYDDITWCGNECDNTECRRNLANRRSKTGMFSMSMFKDTETCPLYEANKKGDTE